MKNIVRALIFISISLAALNCTNDESMPVQGKVQFALTTSSESSDGGRISSQSFPEGAYITLSIETASGASVYSFERINLIKLGDAYITAPLAISEESYRLTDFLVMSENGDVLYATPKEGSPLASLVTHPLPMNFSITADGIVNLDVQVVDADQQSPEDFGYVSFGVEVVESDFSISVFTEDNNSLNLTSATLRLFQGTDLVYTQSLMAKVNPMNFKGDHNASYTLVVEKEGYTIKTKKYVLGDLLNELDGEPLTFLLSPASTLTILVKEPSAFGLRLTTGSDDIYIDWGDGVIERAMITSGYFAELHHTYDNVGRYQINITGDISSITAYEFIWINYEAVHLQNIENMDITRLSEVRMMNLSWRLTPQEIDFSHNTKLEDLDLSYSNIQELDISNNTHLKMLRLHNTNIVHHDTPGDQSKLIKIIDDINQHAIDNNLTLGLLAYETWGARLPDHTREKLINLQNNYKWFIFPYPN